MNILVLPLICVVLPGAFAQIPSQNTLKCRVCRNARTLADCSTQTFCDNRTEECFMDEVITPTLELVYRGGCRAISQCTASSTAIGKRQGELISCSECCKTENDCNTRMCGIKDPIDDFKCYYCEKGHSDQSEVRDPKDCTTLTLCDSSQACYAQNQYHPGSDMSFRYGCFNFQMCRIMMKTAFDDLNQCLGHNTNLTACSTSMTEVCNFCCRGGGCNYGDCHIVRQQLFEEYKRGLFSLDTLESSSGVTG
ncbi:uncharacterized protein LOC128226756 [Mya arenaria]|uniref:uncharacterized protein LOC128226756 n=1 Tax=Mya arenaria TaxID=6604 RepID=UPI0022E4A40A|nr:uncharacterized protein LOC128226756 [Mya arenaria]